MDIKYLEENFIKLHKDLYGNQPIIFYVPTEEHSSGFDKIEIDDMEDGEYDVTQENECRYPDDYLIFEEIVKDYPKITLDREYAFYGKFVSWEEIEQAFMGNLKIDFFRI